jgi:hypothetical protein
VLYSPELACNATIEAVFSNATQGSPKLDLWEAWRLLQPLASPADLDLAQARVDARRFASAASLASALNRMPAPARAHLAAALTGRLDALPSEVARLPAVIAAAAYGPLKPWVCLPTFEKTQAKVKGDLLGAMSMAMDLLARTALRLDEPGAAIAAIIGDSQARPRLLAACRAISEALATVANETAPELRAAGKAAGAARRAAGAARAAVRARLHKGPGAAGAGDGDTTASAEPRLRALEEGGDVEYPGDLGEGNATLDPALV